MPLTMKQVEHAKPGRHSDGNGLYLLVKPKPDDPAKGGAKSWVLRVQYKGRRSDFGLGGVHLATTGIEESVIPLTQRRSLTLQEAREKARIGRELAKVGINPSKEWRREEAIVPTFEAAARQYHAHVANAWRNGKHGAQWLTTLETYAFPFIGARTVDEVDATAIQAVLVPIWLTIPETARRVRQRLFTVLDFAKGKGWRDGEAPMRAVNTLMKRIKQPKKSNYEAMPYGDIPGFVAQMRAGASSIGRMGLLFTILTAARSGEVRGATWSEIDWEAKEWRVPPGRMKAAKLHIVPLPSAALEILEEVRMLGCEPDAPIFPGMKGQALSDATLSKALRVSGGGTATVHGFRSSFRDWAADSGFPDAWAEAALAHGVKDKTEASYRRTTYYEHRRDKLMPAWARFVLGDASNVVALAPREAASA